VRVAREETEGQLTDRDAHREKLDAAEQALAAADLEGHVLATIERRLVVEARQNRQLLEGRQAEVGAASEDWCRVDMMQREAQHHNVASETDLAMLRQSRAKDNARRESQLVPLRKKVDRMRKAEQDEKDRVEALRQKELRKEARIKKAASKKEASTFLAHAARLAEEGKEMRSFVAAQVAGRPDMSEEMIDSLKRAIDGLMARQRLTDFAEVAGKLEELRKQSMGLKSDATVSESRLSTVERDYAGLKDSFTELRAAGNAYFHIKQLDQINTDITDAERNLERTAAQFERMATLLASTHYCLEDLDTKLAVVPSSMMRVPSAAPPPADGPPDAMVSQLKQCGERVISLAEALSSGRALVPPPMPPAPSALGDRGGESASGSPFQGAEADGPSPPPERKPPPPRKRSMSFIAVEPEPNLVAPELGSPLEIPAHMRVAAMDAAAAAVSSNPNNLRVLRPPTRVYDTLLEEVGVEDHFPPRKLEDSDEEGGAEEEEDEEEVELLTRETIRASSGSGATITRTKVAPSPRTPRGKEAAAKKAGKAGGGAAAKRRG